MKFLERRLLLEEERSGLPPQPLRKSHVFSALASCNGDGTERTLDASGVDRLWRVLALLERTPPSWGLWDELSVLSFALIAVARSSAPDAADHASELLDRMEWPDERHYGAVLSSYARKRRKGGRGEADADADVVKGIVADMAERGVPMTGTTASALLACYKSLGMAREAEKWLTKMEGGRDGRSAEGRWKPSLACYNAVLSAWARSDDPDAVDRAEALLHDMKGTAGAAPDVVSYGALLSCYARRGMGRKALDLLRTMHSLHASGELSRPPSAVCYGTVVDALAKSDDADAPDRAEDLVRRMERADDNGVGVGQRLPWPNVVTYNSLLDCYAKFGRADEAEGLLWRMMLGRAKADPDAVSCNVALRALAEATDDASDVSDRAERLLARAEELHGEDRARRRRLQPNVLGYNLLLKCLAREGKGSKSLEVLERMRRRRDAGNLRDGPDVVSYNTVLSALLKSGKRGALECAESLLAQMQASPSGSGGLGAVPDVVTYQTLLRLYANRGEAEKAQRLLRRMEDLYGAGKLMDRPSMASYDLVLDTIVRHRARNDDGTGAAAIEDELLSRAVQSDQQTTPALKTYNQMLDRYAKGGRATDAERLLDRMHELFASKKIADGPDMVSYGSVMDALSRCADDDAPERAGALMTRCSILGAMGGGGAGRPTLRLFNSQLNCYANRGMADEAGRLLDRMHEMHEEGELDECPDAVSYSTVVKALTNSKMGKRATLSRAKALTGKFERLCKESLIQPNVRAYTTLLQLYAKWGAGTEADRLLAKMRSLHEAGKLSEPPNAISYTCALNAWARSRDRAAPAKAEATLRRMEGPAEDAPPPDAVAYNSLLRCYAVRGMAHEAELLLSKMEKARLAGKNLAGPDRVSYTTVVDALSRSRSADAPERAVALLDRMRELHAAGRPDIEPDDATYSSVVRCKVPGRDPREIAPLERSLLMNELQIEDWPFAHEPPPWALESHRV